MLLRLDIQRQQYFAQYWNAHSDYSKLNFAHKVFEEKPDKETENVVDAETIMLPETQVVGSFICSCGIWKQKLLLPHTWYPHARQKNRNVFLHVGPTNSGKTYYALKQLESSSSGVYCGPLRLLAWEVAKRLNKSNVPCDLITGQEREEVEGARHKSVTVEMADVASDYDCAIIDEIQMIGCRSRGFAFTRALLGLAANELHLCGDAAAVPLVEEILKVTGDAIKVQYYERLSPLVPLKVPLGSFSNIRIGDCVVTFSRTEIYRMKKQIEAGGKHRCSVVYGSLPAGRYKSNFSVGEATCLDADDLPLLHSSLDSPSPVLERADLFPNFNLLYMYSHLHPKHGLHDILEHFLDNAKLSEHYFIANCEEMLKVATLIDTLPLSLHDKYLFCISPVDMDDDISSQGLTQFATNYSKNGLVRLREIFTPGTLKVPKSHTALQELESIHKVLDLYVWLSYRLEESFPDRELASSQKAICSMLIEEFLERLRWQRPRTKRLTHNSKLISLISRETTAYLALLVKCL
ncbi:hypothetical protein K7X08_005740 [Anisodus acutangulus]|uniref:RNA helicase n=1 Tax=Anisodus acutangulus TaxID=402998 RepID=A0A9Q1LW09_9SOLA|nr:hypothetical protein K7X08_005740 [Anisodus acutangulus]